MTSQPIRVLIHKDDRLLERVVGVIESAIVRYPETWSKVEGRPSIVDHYAYCTDVLAATVLVKEYASNFYRLTIRPWEDSVHRELAAIMIEQLSQVGASQQEGGAQP